MVNYHLKIKRLNLRGIIRRLAGRIIDSAFFIKSPANLKNCLVILHGASCSGKSYALRWIKRRFKGCEFIEMDRFLYNRVLPDPKMLEDTLDLLMESGFSGKQALGLIRKVETSDLIDGKYPRHRGMVELLKVCIHHDTVIATCADLPPPNLDNGYYELMGQCTSKTILHVLIAPDDNVLAERLRSRGRGRDMDRWFLGNSWRLDNRDYYDIVFNGTEPIGDMLNRIRKSISMKQAKIEPV